jgi:hypothetical protein
MSYTDPAIYNKTHPETFARIIRVKNIEIQRARENLAISKCYEAREKQVYGTVETNRNILEQEKHLSELENIYSCMVNMNF